MQVVETVIFHVAADVRRLANVAHPSPASLPRLLLRTPPARSVELQPAFTILPNGRASIRFNAEIAENAEGQGPSSAQVGRGVPPSRPSRMSYQFN